MRRGYSYPMLAWKNFLTIKRNLYTYTAYAIVYRVICRLETWIGNIVDWKHRNRLETFKVDWKQN